MLEAEAHERDAEPADRTEQQRLAAGADELYDIAVETDGCHRHHDAELGNVLQRREYLTADAEASSHRRHDRGDDEIEDEHRESPAQAETARGPLASGVSGCLSRRIYGQQQRDRDDGECACELDRHRGIECASAEAPHAVPGRSGRRDRRSIVDGRTCEHAEPGATARVKAEQCPEPGERHRCNDIVKEDDGDRLGYHLIVGLYDRSRGRYGRATADRGTYSDERGRLALDAQRTMQYPGDDEGGRYRADDDGQRQHPCLHDDMQVQSEAEQHHGRLQYDLRRPFDAAGRPPRIGPDERKQHADEYSEYRPADDGHLLPEQPCHHSDGETGHDSQSFT